MNAADPLQIIRERLTQAFQPSYLEVIDESAQHGGHAGYLGAGGHVAIIISSTSLQGVSRVEAHRRIYSLFQDMMPAPIHAMRIEVRV